MRHVSFDEMEARHWTGRYGTSRIVGFCGYWSKMAAGIFGILITGVVLSMTTGCQRRSSKFDQPPFPFTFSYPIAFKLTKTSTEMKRLIEAEEYENLTAVGGVSISVSQHETRPETGIYRNGAPRSFQAVRKERCGGREVLFTEEDAVTPLGKSHVMSYLFSRGGKTWGVDFMLGPDFGSPPSDPGLAAGASSLFCQSVSFRDPDNLIVSPPVLGIMERFLKKGE